MTNRIEERQTERRKARLIERLSSDDYQTAMRALWEIRAYGWLWDGLLVRADLSGANLAGGDLSGGDLRKVWLIGARLAGADLSQSNLTGADLSSADLSGAYLRKSNLSRANLAGANLTGLDVDEATLCRCGGLVGATMPDGSLYDGRYRLPGDLDPLRLAGGLGDDEGLADWYGVPTTAYQTGQRWANEHLVVMRS
jgi:hypothetical protein